MQALYSAKLGLLAQQQKVDTIANNIANISTTGFKSRSTSFKDTLYTEIINPADVQSTADLQQGTGVTLSSTYCDYSQGTKVETGEALDFYIEGGGFFTVADSEGNMTYTRCGSFAVSSEEDGPYLVTAQGYYVLDSELNSIKLPDNAEDLSVSENGELYVGDEPSFATLNIVTFVNKDGLSSVGDSCYVATGALGEAIESGAKVYSGYLEASNVDLTVEMANLIQAQRAYSLAGKAITTWNEM
ncbi:MAG: flagellar hook-basal body protein, partial [Eubacteriales bacterium]|nr:flagellar hook-basal body protein [Eubacteriales bacterium]